VLSASSRPQSSQRGRAPLRQTNPLHELYLVHSPCCRLKGETSASSTMSSDALKSVPFPLPSLDRPFGAHLWPIFERAFSTIKGYPPQDFRFQAGETPLSTLRATATMLVTYYVAVLGGRELMRSRPPFKLNGLFMIHNLYLTIISGSLLALFIEQLAPTVWRRGVFFAICDHQGGWTDELVILYYVCHVMKSIGIRWAN